MATKTRYHEGKDGQFEECTAEPGRCSLGGKHYDSIDGFYADRFDVVGEPLMKDSDNPVKFAMDADGLHVTDDIVYKRMEKKVMTASVVTGMFNCPASHAANRYAPRPLDNPAKRGTIFHKVMEDFYSFPAHERTTDKMKETVSRVCDMPENRELMAKPEALSWLRTCINNYYDMGGNPQKVKVSEVDGRPGLELFVRGHVGDNSRDILGFVDRVVDSGDSGVIIEDWKTGARAHRWTGKGYEGLAEARQQTIYALLLEQKGVDVRGARLLYPKAREVVPVPVTDPQLRSRTVSDVEKATDVYNECVSSRTFPFKPGPLCPWCPLAKRCPKAKIRNYAKAQKAFESQPDSIDCIA